MIKIDTSNEEETTLPEELSNVNEWFNYALKDKVI
jgi:hypothetical protein